MELIRFYYVIDVNDPEQIYVGSTKLTLQERLHNHWTLRNSVINRTGLSFYMKDKNKTDFEIFLIEEKECNKLERKMIEDEYIQQMGLLNRSRAIKDPAKKKQYRKDTNNHRNEYARLWRLKKKQSQQ
jgi:hypothetical protein